MKFKKPSNTVCLIVLALLVFIVFCTAILFHEVRKVVTPLDTNGNTITSVYADFQEIESSEEYSIYRDIETDVLYIEMRRNGYSSALSPLYNGDGTLKKYSQF